MQWNNTSMSFVMRLQSGEIIDVQWGWTGWEARFYGTKKRAEIMFTAADNRNFDDEAHEARHYAESTTSRALRQDMEEASCTA